MTAKILAAAVVAVLLVASVAFVGPALAHGDELTAPADEPTTNDTWTGHAETESQGEWPAWMTDHVTDEQTEWMESHGGPHFGTTDDADRHVDATQQPRWGGGYGNGC